MGGITGIGWNSNIPDYEELVIYSIIDNNNFESTRTHINMKDCFNNNQRYNNQKLNLLNENYV